MDTILQSFSTNTKKLCETFQKEITGIRANRPSPGLVEDIKVLCYGQMMPIRQIGTVGVVPPREITIQVWDDGVIPSVIKAIDSARLGFSARNDGKIIRIHLPELSEERRNELIKHVKKIAEEHRIQLRHMRDETNKQIQKACDDHTIGEDQKFKLKEGVQQQTEKTNKTIETLCETKIKEIYT